MELLKTDKANPRNIPEAPFIDKVETFVKNHDFDDVMKAFQDRLQQYKYMELSKKNQLADLDAKRPDIEKNLEIIKHLQQKQDDELDEDDDETNSKIIETNYELNDSLYTTATIDTENLKSVYLWLGAEVMLEYPLDEAIALLDDRLKKNLENVEIIKEDLIFLKENITTMEVNTARLYNWDVEKRRSKVEEGTKNLKI